MRICRYKAQVLYSYDKKLIFDIDTIVENLGMLLEQFCKIITTIRPLRSELIDYLQQNGIDKIKLLFIYLVLN